jgi:hypothetical protein
MPTQLLQMCSNNTTFNNIESPQFYEEIDISARVCRVQDIDEMHENKDKYRRISCRKRAGE